MLRPYCLRTRMLSPVPTGADVGRLVADEPVIELGQQPARFVVNDFRRASPIRPLPPPRGGPAAGSRRPGGGEAGRPPRLRCGKGSLSPPTHGQMTCSVRDPRLVAKFASPA